MFSEVVISSSLVAHHGLSNFCCWLAAEDNFPLAWGFVEVDVNDRLGEASDSSDND